MADRSSSARRDPSARPLRRVLRNPVALGLFTLACLGCGGGALDAARVNQVSAAMRAAEEMGANDLPKASLHLDLARDEMARAEHLAREGEEEDAALLLARARADAELALQLTKTDQEQQKAREAWQKTQRLDPFPETNAPAGPVPASPAPVSPAPAPPPVQNPVPPAPLPATPGPAPAPPPPPSPYVVPAPTPRDSRIDDAHP